jgi:hypothetical protein
MDAFFTATHAQNTLKKKKKKPLHTQKPMPGYKSDAA